MVAVSVLFLALPFSFPAPIRQISSFLLIARAAMLK
jgi:hypothetical protein